MTPSSSAPCQISAGSSSARADARESFFLVPSSSFNMAILLISVNHSLRQRFRFGGVLAMASFEAALNDAFINGSMNCRRSA